MNSVRILLCCLVAFLILYLSFHILKEKQDVEISENFKASQCFDVNLYWDENINKFLIGADNYQLSKSRCVTDAECPLICPYCMIVPRYISDPNNPELVSTNAGPLMSKKVSQTFDGQCTSKDSNRSHDQRMDILDPNLINSGINIPGNLAFRHMDPSILKNGITKREQIQNAGIPITSFKSLDVKTMENKNLVNDNLNLVTKLSPDATHLVTQNNFAKLYPENNLDPTNAVTLKRDQAVTVEQQLYFAPNLDFLKNTVNDNLAYIPMVKVKTINNTPVTGYIPLVTQQNTAPSKSDWNLFFGYANYDANFQRTGGVPIVNEYDNIANTLAGGSSSSSSGADSSSENNTAADVYILNELNPDLIGRLVNAGAIFDPTINTNQTQTTQNLQFLLDFPSLGDMHPGAPQPESLPDEPAPESLPDEPAPESPSEGIPGGLPSITDALSCTEIMNMQNARMGYTHTGQERLDNLLNFAVQYVLNHRQQLQGVPRCRSFSSFGMMRPKQLTTNSPDLLNFQTYLESQLDRLEGLQQGAPDDAETRMLAQIIYEFLMLMDNWRTFLQDAYIYGFNVPNGGRALPASPQQLINTQDTPNTLGINGFREWLHLRLLYWKALNAIRIITSRLIVFR